MGVLTRLVGGEVCLGGGGWSVVWGGKGGGCSGGVGEGVAIGEWVGGGIVSVGEVLVGRQVAVWRGGGMKGSWQAASFEGFVGLLMVPGVMLEVDTFDVVGLRILMWQRKTLRLWRVHAGEGNVDLI